MATTNDASFGDMVPAGEAILYADSIAAFIDDDRRNLPISGGIVFVGSSIFREWTRLGEQLAPLPVLNRAFGGARTWEVLHYTQSIVLPYAPRIIVYYCGSNDINAGETPEAIAQRYQRFSCVVAEQLPETYLYFVAIFRAPQKQDRWDIVDETNRLIRDYSAGRNHRGFIDANPVVFDAGGQPRTQLYQADSLHFTEAAYEELAAFIQPVLQKAWQNRNR